MSRSVHSRSRAADSSSLPLKSRKSLEFDKENADSAELNSSIERSHTSRPKKLSQSQSQSQSQHQPTMTLPATKLDHKRKFADASHHRNEPTSGNEKRNRRPFRAALSDSMAMEDNLNQTRTAVLSHSIAVDLKSQNSFHSVLASKDQQFDELLSRYRALKAEKKSQNDERLEKMSESHSKSMKAAEEISHHWKAEYDNLKYATERAAEEKEKKLKFEIKRLEESESEWKNSSEESERRVVELTKLIASKDRKLSGLQKQIDAFQLLTATQISAIPSPDGESGNFVNVKTIDPSTDRVMEFVIRLDGEDTISYAPKRIQTNKIVFPSSFKRKVEIEPAEMPVLMKKILNVIYHRDELNN